MSFSHLVILGIILIIVIPPEKLPEVMRNLGRVLNELRRSTSGVFDELKREAAIRPEDLLKQRSEQYALKQKEEREKQQTVAAQTQKSEGSDNG